MSFYTLALLLFAFCSFFIGVLVWLKRQDATGRMFFIFNVSVSFWGLAHSILTSPNVSYETALLWGRMSHVGAILIPVTWYHLTLLLSEEARKYRKFLIGLYFIAFTLECFVLFPAFIPRVGPSREFLHYLRPGPVYHVFAIMFFIVVPLGFVQLAKKIRSSRGEERLQVRGFFISTFAGFFGGSLAFLPVYEIMLPQYALFLMPIYPFAMAYFMIRHRLFDLEQILQAAHREKLAAIGTLATSINHEIRNPLFVIKGMAESHLENLKDGLCQNNEELIQRYKKLLETTIEQAERTMDIIKRFSLFAKQGTNREAQFEEVNLRGTFQDILPLVRHEFELDSIKLIEEIPDDLPPIHADRRHIEEVFFNLIVNACQAMKNGGKLTVRVEQRNEKVQIEIKDTGSGIPGDRLNKIFEPFYTTKESGTGLGLYITKQLVERNQGRIKVKSRVGKGTTFTLSFPAFAKAKGASQATATIPSPDAELVREEPV